MKSLLLWDVMQHGLVVIDGRFGPTYKSHLQGWSGLAQNVGNYRSTTVTSQKSKDLIHTTVEDRHVPNGALDTATKIRPRSKFCNSPRYNIYSLNKKRKKICYTWLLQSIPGTTSFLRNTKQYNHFSYIRFKIDSLCIYAFVSDCKDAGNTTGSHFV